MTTLTKAVFISFMLVCLTGILPGKSESQWSDRCLTNNAFDNRYASYSPDGSWIIFESNRDGNWEIYMMDYQGKRVKRLTNNPAEDRRPCWHPDGKKVLFESNQSGAFELYTINVNTLKKRKLSYSLKHGEPIFASYAPNGKVIAVCQKVSQEESRILLLNPRGKKIKTLVENGKRNFFPRWSGDGNEIVYFSRKETDNQVDEIYRLNVQSGEEMRLTNWSTHNFCPSWSPDNSWIAYVTSMEDSRPEIYIMDKDGKNQQRITYNNDGDTLPSWHPSEHKILITAYRNGSFQICELVLI